MNEGRIWLYVNPSVGLPIFFLVWVAGTALMVHLAVLNNTTWYKEFLQGGAAVAAAPAMEAAPAAEAMAPAADEMAPAAEAPAAACK